MDTYTKISYDLCKTVTERYSTSFSMSSTLFSNGIRRHIYAIYALVRIADEIVDTYRNDDARQQLDTLERETVAALKSGYSTNPIVHAFATTARSYTIGTQLIAPFFASMRTDLTATHFTSTAYTRYIYGSAEVVGLMCLKVFVGGDEGVYSAQAASAKALGSAYQKVNFLRDIKADYQQLGRMYFPDVTFEQFDDTRKNLIIADIEKDFTVAQHGISQLPPGARKAVRVSYRYYNELLRELKKTPASVIKHKRIRLPNSRKIWLLAGERIKK